MARNPFNPYTVGRRVYNSGSYAPTQGTVNPAGYVERELNKPASGFSHMPSQSRSGLAGAALQRIRDQKLIGQDRTGSIATAPLNSRTGPQPGSSVGSILNDPRFKNITRGGSQAYRDTQNGGVGRFPSVGSNSSGQLYTNPVAKPVPISSNPQQPELRKEDALPYDPIAADSQAEGLDQYNQLLNMLLEREQALEQDWTVNTRDIELQRPEAFRNLLNSFAGRGMSFSSGYGQEFGETEGEFARALGDLLNWRNMGREGIGRQRAEGSRSYNKLLERIQREAARRLAEQAGDLGLKPPPGAPGSPGSGLGGVGESLPSPFPDPYTGRPQYLPPPRVVSNPVPGHPGAGLSVINYAPGVNTVGNARSIQDQARDAIQANLRRIAEERRGTASAPTYTRPIPVVYRRPTPVARPSGPNAPKSPPRGTLLDTLLRVTRRAGR
jgi:hypothetical protein